MLCFICVISLPLFLPIIVLSYALSPKEGIVARRIPKIRPTLRVCCLLIAILAIDFAANSLWRAERRSSSYSRMWMRPWSVVGNSLALTLTAARDLWGLGFCVGVIGMLSMPAVIVH